MEGTRSFFWLSLSLSLSQQSHMSPFPPAPSQALAWPQASSPPTPASPHLAGELALGQADLWPLSHLQVSPRASPSHPALNPLPDNYRDGWGWLLPEKRQ